MLSLSFEEFIVAMGQDGLLKLLQANDRSLIKSFKEKFINLIREYYYVGGMPEVVSSFIMELFVREQELKNMTML